MLDDWSHLTPGECVTLLGTVWMTTSVLLFAVTTLRRFGCVRADGVVVDNEPCSSDGGGTRYRAVFAYTVPSGEQRTISHDVILPTPLPTDGTARRTVWHHPSRPARTHLQLNAGPVPLPLLYALGILVTAVGLTMRLGFGR